MITENEIDKIKSALNFKTGHIVSIYAPKDKSKIFLEKCVYDMINERVELYKHETGKKIGKGAYLHMLLQQFVREQPAILESISISPESFSTVLNGLQSFKRIMRYYVDDSITTQSQVVLSLIIYSDTRLYEIQNGLKVIGFVDYEYGYDIDENNNLVRIETTANVSELFSKARNDGLALEVD